MAVLKCKMCGGQLDIQEEQTVIECEYCGTKQTVPVLDDEKKVSLFSRANKLRAACDFDKAFSVYESIVAEYENEAEGYWGLILCKYGIEYVDDPASGKKVPTCHRSSFDSVIDDPNFDLVMENADSVARKVYRDEAKQIEELRTKIIEISSNEEPYDIFICYKETAEDGNRTIDSVIAQDVYTELTNKGYKVFFSRITLEDKLGQEYEPYIFSALNSAKVMLVFGTDYEYFNAVWVKNEWSRYLKLMSGGQKKTLIPCYKDIDAYDMPKEFKHLQAQDMGKVGATQDLLRGIEKIIPLKSSVEVKETVVVQQLTGNPTSNSLLKRVFMFLEDNEWNSANEYCEKVLDIDPENAEAYLGKLMAELKVNKKMNLRNCSLPFDNKNNYKKALRFGNEELKNLLIDSIKHINDRNENKRKDQIYTEANKLMSEDTVSSYEKAANMFTSISNYKDSNVLANKCIELKENSKNIKKKVKSFIKDLKNEKVYENERNSRLQQLNEEILELNDKKIELLQLYNILGSTLQKIEEINNSLFKNKEKIVELKKTRESLGIFAGKQKKEIDAEIFVVEKESSILDEKLSELKKKAKGYTSVEDLLLDLNSVSQKLVELNNQKNEFESRPIKTEEEMISEMMQTEEGKLVVMQYRKIQEKYIQENIISFGKYANEMIEWKVLVFENDKALLITKDAIDCKKYNEKYEYITWETCSLRRWLNNDFINQAFDGDEKEQILITKVEPHKNPKYDTKQGNITNDKIFLLSIKEVNQYLKSNDERCCKLSTKADKGNCSWWLRSSGNDHHYAAYVRAYGSVDVRGYGVGYDNYGVRPALWIDLESLSVNK